MVQSKPEKSCTAIKNLNLRLYFIFSQPKTNLKIVLRIQKIELSFAAPYLSLIPLLTA
jgi:hypothetical protein